MMTQLLFTRRHGLRSLLIRAITWSRWSHVDFVDPDDPAYVIGALDDAVQRVPIRARLDEASKAELVTLKEIDPKPIRRYITGCIGMGYDWPGVMRFILPWHRQNPDKMFCSELIALGFRQAGYPLVANVHRASPADIRDSELVRSAKSIYLK